ncbi:HisA/HisF-related TIM barrel protein [Schlesneria paludicola]|uniref:HisA/HisF-related TIM barrel protein n=1 Tax=Schlesneria paludicola TaxID=360056 RepID=UPI00029A8668|nr:HisA/HisF-related TIM barrel protein [Schlesneria paludicola]
MIVIPVLDVLNGQVVRGVAGRRSDYRPIISRLSPRTDPVSVAQSLRDSFGFKVFYVADLDGILHGLPNLTLYRQLSDLGLETLVDGGVCDVDGATTLINAGATRIIVGLETCRSPDALAQLVAAFPDLIFSLDLQQGVPRRAIDSVGWYDDATRIANQISAAKIRSILVLDLADVGTGTGGSTDKLCRRIRTEFPEISVITGGGVRGAGDLRRLHRIGANQVLVASALHDGRLTREELAEIQNDVDKVGSDNALGS